MSICSKQAKAYLETGDFDSAKQTLERVIGGMGSYVPQVSDMHHMLGRIYQRASNARKAYFHYCKCFEIRQNCGESKGVAEVCEDLADVMRCAGQDEYAMQLCALSLRMKTLYYKTDDMEIASSLFAFARATSLVNQTRSQNYTNEGKTQATHFRNSLVL